jgi:SagB-type dehydrogenase family enzyme
MRSNAGDDFQKETKYVRNAMPGRSLNWEAKPDVYKIYPGSKTIQLTNETPKISFTLTEAFKNRISNRTFSSEPLRKADLGYLLWASTGIQRTEQGYDFRTAPSAGALYPIETYLIVNNVKEIEPGAYHYNIKDHTLEQINEGKLGSKMAHAVLNQNMCITAAAIFIWTAIFERSKWKYDQRAYRYVYLDSGHIAENLALATLNVKAGSCHIGAFYDDEVNSIINVDGTKESTIYLTVVGYPK